MNLYVSETKSHIYENYMYLQKIYHIDIVVFDIVEIREKQHLTRQKLIDR